MRIFYELILRVIISALASILTSLYWTYQAGHPLKHTKQTPPSQELYHSLPEHMATSLPG